MLIMAQNHASQSIELIDLLNLILGGLVLISPDTFQIEACSNLTVCFVPKADNY